MTVRRLCYIKLIRRFTVIGSRAVADSLFPTDLITADAPINSSSPTVLVVGGGANDSLQNTQSDGTDSSLSPISPHGGGGYVSRQGGNGWLSYGANNASGGEGGQSYVISGSIHAQDSLGNGGAGGYGAPGINGYVDISFYS